LYSFPYLWVHFPASLFSCPPQPSPASSFPPLPSSPIRSRGVGQHEVTSACMAHHEYVSSDGPVRKQQCFANKDTDLPREKRVTVRGKHTHTHTHTHTLPTSSSPEHWQARSPQSLLSLPEGPTS
jgi:hypothetical protein